MDENDITKQLSPDMERMASRNAQERARNAKWDLNVAIFLFAVLIIVIILLFQDIGIEIVAPVALFGLSMVWLVGWRRGRELYTRFYEEELSSAKQELKKTIKAAVRDTVEETIEEKVQKALRERWK